MPGLLLHPQDRPLFSAAMRGAGCAVELRINDVPVFRERGGEAFQIVLPVNEWLFRGSNELQWRTEALPDAAPHAEMCLEFRSAGPQPVSSATPLVTMARWEAAGARPTPPPEIPELEPAPAAARPRGESNFSHPAVRAWRPDERSVVQAANFRLPEPWAPCPWVKGANLTGQKGLLHTIRGNLLRYQSLLTGREVKGCRQFLALRAAALENAYNLRSDSEMLDALLVPRLLADKAWQVAPWPETGLQVEVAGGGRLARLVSDQDLLSPLRLVNEVEGVECVLDAWWAHLGRWELVR